MNIEESNKLIAEFMQLQTAFQDVQIWMDWKNETIPVWDKRDYWLARELKYHSSWDWLMPVFDRIATMVAGFSILDDETWIVISGDIKFEISVSDPEKSIIERTYQAAIEFIKWYNDNK